MRTIALFNNKGGVGKTTLAYHLAYMLARLGWRVLAVDLDPQASLTAAFFDEQQLELFWDPESNGTILSAVAPLIGQLGDIDVPEPRQATERLFVVPGDLGLSRFEDALSNAWPNSFAGDEASMRVTTAFHRVIRACAATIRADVALVDVGPNLGAINRSALLASDDLVVPLAADLLSLQGLRILGPTLRKWRSDWQDLALARLEEGLDAPAGTIRPIGYVVLQHAARLDRPVRAHDRFLARIPVEFHRAVLGEEPTSVEDATWPGVSDPFRLASLRSYRSLMPLAQDARKPMFDLRAADGALGSTGRLVATCFREHEQLARRVMDAAEIAFPVEDAG